MKLLFELKAQLFCSIIITDFVFHNSSVNISSTSKMLVLEDENIVDKFVFDLYLKKRNKRMLQITKRKMNLGKH